MHSKICTQQFMFVKIYGTQRPLPAPRCDLPASPALRPATAGCRPFRQGSNPTWRG